VKLLGHPKRNRNGFILVVVVEDLYLSSHSHMPSHGSKEQQSKRRKRERKKRRKEEGKEENRKQ